MVLRGPDVQGRTTVNYPKVPSTPRRTILLVCDHTPCKSVWTAQMFLDHYVGEKANRVTLEHMRADFAYLQQQDTFFKETDSERELCKSVLTELMGQCNEILNRQECTC